MRLIQGMMALLAGAMMCACGGGGGSAGTSPFNSDTSSETPSTSSATTIEVLASSNSVGTGGDDVTITGIVKDANNNSLPSAAVSFSTDTGTLGSVSATTDAAGVATARLSAGADKSNRTATVRVTSGSVAGTVTVAISGTTLVYSGATTLALGAAVPLTVTAADSRGNPIANLLISVTSSLGNGLSATSGTTDALGQFVPTYTATNAGSDTIRFSGGGASTSTTPPITISGEDFAFTSPVANASVAVGQSQTLSVRYRLNGVPQANVTVNFAATIGTLSAGSAVTNASGIASVSVSSNFAGSAQVSATLSGTTTAAQATLPVSFVATTPDRLVLQVSPTALAPNANGTTINQTTATARVTDASGNPVSGVIVNFSQQEDLSGGTLLQASSATNSNGVATVNYASGPNSTASGGVLLRAAVASNSAVMDEAELTVNQSALFLALGTGNTILNLDAQTYQKDWTVYVTDANGVAVSGVTITVSALPVGYLKGSLAFDTVWGAQDYVESGGILGSGITLPAGTYITCENEDDNRNGVLDAGEDNNGNGTLEPGNVISVTPATLVTNSTGRATLSLIYAESYAPWVQIQLQVEAIVTGTASSTSATFVVGGSSTDFSSATNPPAGVVSPFGQRASCQSSL